MKLGEQQKGRVLEALLAHVRKVKSQALLKKRSEEDYPVALGSALNHLLDEFQFGLDRPASAGGQSDNSRTRAQGLLNTWLQSPEWDQNRIGRKRHKIPGGYTYLFFLPGDEHFCCRPQSQKTYLEMLFNLERKIVPITVEPDQHSAGDPTVHRESFEAQARKAYAKLINRSRGAVYVRIPALFAEMGLEKERFDRGLLRMRDKGEAILSKHGYAASLSSEDARNSIELSPGEYYYYVTLREES